MVMKRFLSWLNPFEGESPGEIHQEYSRRYNDMINDLKTDYSICQHCKHSAYGKRNSSSICICDVCKGNNQYEAMTKAEEIEAILETEFDELCHLCKWKEMGERNICHGCYFEFRDGAFHDLSVLVIKEVMED